MIDGEGKTRKQWNDDTTLPLCAFTMCTNDPMDNRVTNLVLDGHILDSRSTFSIRTQSRMYQGKKRCIRRDEELVFNVNKMFGKLNRYTGVRRIRTDRRSSKHAFEVGILDRVFHSV